MRLSGCAKPQAAVSVREYFVVKSLRLILVFALLGSTRLAAQTPVTAVVDTTLTSGSQKIRQFAFDGDPDTFFLSAQNPRATDHFTIVFDEPVTVHAFAVTTGRPGGGDQLDAGNLVVSGDGRTFVDLAKFKDGVVKFKPGSAKIKAVRVQPGTDLDHPLAIREIVIDAEPPVATFKYPVEIHVDVSEAPEMKGWTEKTARICERNYAMINSELCSDGFKPPHVLTLTMKKNYNGVAYASGSRITGSVKFFKDHPDDVGAMIHETVHCVQQYRTRNNPGWLVEGVADYVRFFKFEPGKFGRLAPDPHYNGSYRTTAAFLAFVSKTYDQDLVRKLNKIMREGEYQDEIWRALTKKSIQELDEEWRVSLKR